MQFTAIYQALIIIALANSAPVIGKMLLADLLGHPIDRGVLWLDGRRLFGSSKTYRGVILSIAACVVGAPLLGVDVLVGAAAGASAMAGDLVSSFIKRRLAIEPSGRAMGLDQIPEALLPALALTSSLSLSVADIGIIVAAFWIGSVALSPFFHWLGLRDRPY